MSGLTYRGAHPTPDGVVSAWTEVTDWRKFGRWVAGTLSPTDQARFLYGLAAGLEGLEGLTQLQYIGIDARRLGMHEQICLLAENLAEFTRPRGEEA